MRVTQSDCWADSVKKASEQLITSYGEPADTKWEEFFTIFAQFAQEWTATEQEIEKAKCVGA